MDKLIYKYFNKNYRMTLSTYSSYKLYDKVSESDISLKTVLISMTEIFSVSQEEIHKVFEKWSDKESVIINNRIVELQEQLYIISGKSVVISPNDINKLLDKVSEEERGIIFAPYLPANNVALINPEI